MPVPDGKLVVSPDEALWVPFFVVEYARRIPKRKREPLTDRNSSEVLFAPCIQHRRNADGVCTGEALGTLEAAYIVSVLNFKLE